MSVRVPSDIKEGISVLSNMSFGLSQGKVIEGLWLYLLEKHSMEELYEYMEQMNFSDGRKKSRGDVSVESSLLIA